MNRTLALAAAILLAPLSAAADEDPLAPARGGALQCYKPDTANKTCRALAGYTFDANGGILNQAEVLLLSSPLVVIKSVSPVAMKDGAVCGPMRREDIEAATILVGGHPLSAGNASSAKARIEAALGDRLGQEFCTTYMPQGAGFTTRVTIGGVEAPDQTATVIWVQPADGYTVAPPALP